MAAMLAGGNSGTTAIQAMAYVLRVSHGSGHVVSQRTKSEPITASKALIGEKGKTMTVPKNTKRAKHVIENARNIKCFSLSNDFRGEPLADAPMVWGGEVVNNQYTKLIPVTQAEFLARELNGHNVKLIAGENGRYCIHVHSNLWYDFEVAA